MLALLRDLAARPRTFAVTLVVAAACASCKDAASPTDLSVPDLAAAATADLAVARDLSAADLAAADLAAADLARSPDLARPDLAVPRDLTTRADLACPDCGLFTCCGGACVNPDNDVHNCGACGVQCDGLHPFCDRGKCAPPPCDVGRICAGVQGCCGAACCAVGELCCDVPGPISFGPKCTPPTAEGTCPRGCKGCVCNPEGTLIAGPRGDRPIESLAEGDLVYSVEGGRMVTVPLLRTQRVSVHDHVMVRLVFEDGRSLSASPRHPTADGRPFERLAPGDRVDGARLARVEVVPYRGAATYDILPASTSGAYYAGGILIGSTMSPPARAVTPRDLTIAPTSPSP